MNAFGINCGSNSHRRTEKNVDKFGELGKNSDL